MKKCTKYETKSSTHIQLMPLNCHKGWKFIKEKKEDILKFPFFLGRDIVFFPFSWILLFSWSKACFFFFLKSFFYNYPPQTDLIIIYIVNISNKGLETLKNTRNTLSPRVWGKLAHIYTFPF